MLTAVAGDTPEGGYCYSGDHDLPEAIAAGLIAAGMAVSLEPETASIAPPENAMRPRGRPRGTSR